MSINLNILAHNHVQRLIADDATFIPDETTIYNYLEDYFEKYGTFANITYQNDMLSFGWKTIAEQTKLYSLNAKYDILVNLTDIENMTTMVHDIEVRGSDLVIIYTDGTEVIFPIPEPDLTPYARLDGATFTGDITAPTYYGDGSNLTGIEQIHYQREFDAYTGSTKYMGYAPDTITTAETGWTINKLTTDINGESTKIEYLNQIWDDRYSL